MDESFYREQRARLGAVAAEHEVVITTAAVPGRPAPRLLTAEAVGAMPLGSIVVDLAAERGGNCELTKPGETVEVDGRHVIGPIDLASTVPHHASLMYARNLAAFLALFAKAGARLSRRRRCRSGGRRDPPRHAHLPRRRDRESEGARAARRRDGRHAREGSARVKFAAIAIDPLMAAIGPSPASTEALAEAAATASHAPDGATLALLATIFVLAIFVGFEIITKVPPTLHTPLMSGSNAISGITLVGALSAAGAGEGSLATLLGFAAVVLATVNVVGGFLVTHRMLAMFPQEGVSPWARRWSRTFAYLVAAILFILGLKGLTHPRTAVRGNLIGALGMLLAVVVTLLDRSDRRLPVDHRGSHAGRRGRGRSWPCASR